MRQSIALVAFGGLGWALCGTVMGLGLSFGSLQTALVIHAIAAPIVFGVLAAVYFGWFPNASPVRTAAAWLAIVVALDLVVVAVLIERSLAMFESPLGTWIPFGLIFLSTLSVGLRTRPRLRILR